MNERMQWVSSSAWSVRLGLFAVGLVVASVLFHRLFGMSTPLALNLFVVAFLIAGVAILSGIHALVRIWQRGYRGTSAAFAGILIGAVLLGWPLSLVPTLRQLPAINDVTTDTSDPPAFIVLAAQRPKGANSPVHPGERFAELQRAGYRDLQPLKLNRTQVEAFDIVGLALRRLRMETVNEIPYGTDGRQWGLIEATDRTLVLGFVDDVSVRVRPDGRGTRIDVRSASRYGRHDLGRNAERVRTILNEIVARAEASVPGRRGQPGQGRGRAPD
jgi:uncharacterized protein (DUF1499 family)